MGGRVRAHALKSKINFTTLRTRACSREVSKATNHRYRIVVPKEAVQVGNASSQQMPEGSNGRPRYRAIRGNAFL